MRTLFEYCSANSRHHFLPTWKMLSQKKTILRPGFSRAASSISRSTCSTLLRLNRSCVRALTQNEQFIRQPNDVIVWWMVLRGLSVNP